MPTLVLGHRPVELKGVSAASDIVARVAAELLHLDLFMDENKRADKEMFC